MVVGMLRPLCIDLHLRHRIPSSPGLQCPYAGLCPPCLAHQQCPGHSTQPGPTLPSCISLTLLHVFLAYCIYCTLFPSSKLTAVLLQTFWPGTGHGRHLPYTWPTQKAFRLFIQPIFKGPFRKPLGWFHYTRFDLTLVLKTLPKSFAHC